MFVDDKSSIFGNIYSFVLFHTVICLLFIRGGVNKVVFVCIQPFIVLASMAVHLGDLMVQPPKTEENQNHLVGHGARLAG